MVASARHASGPSLRSLPATNGHGVRCTLLGRLLRALLYLGVFERATPAPPTEPLYRSRRRFRWAVVGGTSRAQQVEQQSSLSLLRRGRDQQPGALVCWCAGPPPARANFADCISHGCRPAQSFGTGATPRDAASFVIQVSVSYWRRASP